MKCIAAAKVLQIIRASVYYKTLSERQTTENVGFYAIQSTKNIHFFWIFDRWGQSWVKSVLPYYLYYSYYLSHPYLLLLCWQRSPLVHNWRETASPTAYSQAVSSISLNVTSWDASLVQRNLPTQRRKNTRMTFPFWRKTMPSGTWESRREKASALFNVWKRSFAEYINQ